MPGSIKLFSLQPTDIQRYIFSFNLPEEVMPLMPLQSAIHRLLSDPNVPVWQKIKILSLNRFHFSNTMLWNLLCEFNTPYAIKFAALLPRALMAGYRPSPEQVKALYHELSRRYPSRGYKSNHKREQLLVVHKHLSAYLPEPTQQELRLKFNSQPLQEAIALQVAEVIKSFSSHTFNRDTLAFLHQQASQLKEEQKQLLVAQVNQFLGESEEQKLSTLAKYPAVLSLFNLDPALKQLGKVFMARVLDAPEHYDAYADIPIEHYLNMLSRQEKTNLIDLLCKHPDQHFLKWESRFLELVRCIYHYLAECPEIERLLFNIAQAVNHRRVPDGYYINSILSEIPACRLIHYFDYTDKAFDNVFTLINHSGRFSYKDIFQYVTEAFDSARIAAVVHRISTPDDAENPRNPTRKPSLNLLIALCTKLPDSAEFETARASVFEMISQGEYLEAYADADAVIALLTHLGLTLRAQYLDALIEALKTVYTKNHNVKDSEDLITKLMVSTPWMTQDQEASLYQWVQTIPELAENGFGIPVFNPHRGCNGHSLGLVDLVHVLWPSNFYFLQQMSDLPPADAQRLFDLGSQLMACVFNHYEADNSLSKRTGNPPSLAESKAIVSQLIPLICKNRCWYSLTSYDFNTPLANAFWTFLMAETPTGDKLRTLFKKIYPGLDWKQGAGLAYQVMLTPSRAPRETAASSGASWPFSFFGARAEAPPSAPQAAALEP